MGPDVVNLGPNEPSSAALGTVFRAINLWGPRWILANAVNACVAFFCNPRYLTLEKPHSRLTEPKTCSNSERMRELLRFLTRTASSTTPAHALVGEVFCRACLASNQSLLTGIGRVTVGPPRCRAAGLATDACMHSGWCYHSVVGQTALAIHTNMQLHSEIPCINAPGLPSFHFTTVQSSDCSHASGLCIQAAVAVADGIRRIVPHHCYALGVRGVSRVGPTTV